MLNNLLAEKCMLCSDLDVAFFMGESIKHREALKGFRQKGAEVYHLFDSGTRGSKTEAIAALAQVKLVVAASPDKANYNQHLKRNPLKKFMEPWRFEEMLQVNCASNRPLGEEELKKRCALAGGVPRAALGVTVNIPKEICFEVRNLRGSSLAKVIHDVETGLERAIDTQMSHKVCQVVPRSGRAECVSIPAGMFAACHIRAMASVNEERGIQDLLRSLGMTKNAGVFAGHTLEASVHLAVERMHDNAMTDAVLLSPDAPELLNVWKGLNAWKGLNVWKGSIRYVSQTRAFYDKSDLDGLLKSAPNTYWKAAQRKFAAIDGFFLQEEQGGVCIHFLRVATNEEGQNYKVNDLYLQDYARRLLKGWSGDMSAVLICLWFVLPAILHDDSSGPYATEQKLGMSVKGGKGGDAEVGAETSSEAMQLFILQGKVRFDWSVLRNAPMKIVTDSWWSQNRVDFRMLQSEFESVLIN